MIEKEDNVGKLLCMIHNGMHRSMNNSIFHKKVEGMTGKNGWIIGFLADHSGQPVYQKDLEAEFNVTRSTASKVISLMEKKGFVHRRNVEEDARLKEIELTEKGREAVQLMEQDIQEMEQKLCRGFSPEEKAQFIEFLHRVFDNIEHRQK